MQLCKIVSIKRCKQQKKFKLICVMNLINIEIFIGSLNIIQFRIHCFNTYKSVVVDL